MRRLALFAVVVCLIVSTLGCKRIRYTDNYKYPTELTEANYSRDEQYCLVIASGATPDPQMMPVPQSYSINTYGGANTPFGYSSYSQRTYVDNNQAAAYATGRNIGSMFAAKKQRAQNYNMCMELLGWTLKDRISPAMLEEKQRIDKRYEFYKKYNSDPMFKQVVTYMIEQTKKKPNDEGSVIINAWKENPEIFARDYDLAKPHVEKILEKSTIGK